MGIPARRVLTAVALAALAGCNAILGIGDVHSSSNVDAPLADAAPDANVPACPTPPPNTVIGCARVQHVLPEGSIVVDNFDLSRLTIQALVLDGATMTFTTVPGSGTADGVLTIPNVPDGAPYYLEISDPSAFLTSFFWTDQHSLDLGFTEIGRPGTSAMLNTPVTIDLSALTPWRYGDFVYLDAFSVGTEAFAPPNADVTMGPPSGATALKLTFDWRTAFTDQSELFTVGIGPRMPLLLDQDSDSVVASHVSTTTTADTDGHTFTAQTIVDTLGKSGIHMVDGQPVTISGAVSTTIPSGASVQLSFDMAAVRAAFHDQGLYVYGDVYCQRMVAPVRGAFFGAPLLEVHGAPPANTGTVSLPPQTFAAPMPSSWQPYYICSATHQREVRAPGGSNPNGAPVFVRVIAPATSNYTFAPTLVAPGNIKVGGVAAMNGGAAPFDPTKPLVISWDASPGATRYYVLVQHVTVDAGGHAQNSFVGTINTNLTSVPIPPSLLIKGDFYFFRVGAFHSPVDYGGGHLVELGFPLDEARSVTGIMRLSSLCGNGVKDAGEQCDTGGDSATCDSDCSLVLCGDGHLNTAAGEQCDGIGFGQDTAGCTTACKLPVCGDGDIDSEAGEQCDDGNTASNDGCSSTCTLETCGNGTLDNFEGCDDGNRSAGDGCSPLCMQEPNWTCDTTMTPTKCTRM